MLALLRSCFAPAFGGEPDRFRSFSSAQSFAALLAALCCIALSSKSLKATIRLALCAVLLAAIVLDGSRLWMLAVVVSTGVALFLSDAPEWIKTCIAGVCIGAVATCLAAPGWILDAIARKHPQTALPQRLRRHSKATPHRMISVRTGSGASWMCGRSTQSAVRM
jgi:hypothetical protein